MKLSIGQAWDEAKIVFRTDGGPILAVALALSVLPGAILETMAPTSLRTSETSPWIAVIGLLVALLSLASQLAVSRIALGPSTTVGAALAHAFGRMPALFGALFLVILPFALLMGALGMSQPQALTPGNLSPALSISLLLVLLAGVFVLIRLLFLTPLAADSDLNAVALLRGAWRLSSGRFLKLLLLVLLLMLVALLLVGALGGALSAVVILALGKIAAGNVSALLVALIQQALTATVTVLFVVVVCRLYAQVRGSAEVTVPSAGGE